MPNAYELAWAFLVGGPLLYAASSFGFDALRRHLAYRRNVREAVEWENSWDRRHGATVRAPQAGFAGDRDA